MYLAVDHGGRARFFGRTPSPLSADSLCHLPAQRLILPVLYSWAPPLLTGRRGLPCMQKCEICFSNKKTTVANHQVSSTVPPAWEPTARDRTSHQYGRTNQMTFALLAEFTLPNAHTNRAICTPCGIVRLSNDHTRCRFGMLCYVCFKPAEVRSECGARRAVEEFNMNHCLCCTCGLPWFLP